LAGCGHLHGVPEMSARRELRRTTDHHPPVVQQLY
jgi:hypothetical protein